jgi:hypothetical protein
MVMGLTLGFPCKISGAGILNFDIGRFSILLKSEIRRSSKWIYGFGFNPIYVKHCLDFSFVFSAPLPAWKNPLVSRPGAQISNLGRACRACTYSGPSPIHTIFILRHTFDISQNSFF